MIARAVIPGRILVPVAHGAAARCRPAHRGVVPERKGRGRGRFDHSSMPALAGHDDLASWRLSRRMPASSAVALCCAWQRRSATRRGCANLAKHGLRRAVVVPLPRLTLIADDRKLIKKSVDAR
jgi:hypothetical protein